jgi:hypothetical protein
MGTAVRRGDVLGILLLTPSPVKPKRFLLFDLLPLEAKSFRAPNFPLEKKISTLFT